MPSKISLIKDMYKAEKIKSDSRERGVSYWEYTVVIAVIGLAASAAIPNIKAQIAAVDNRVSTVADNYDSYPLPLVP